MSFLMCILLVSLLHQIEETFSCAKVTLYYTKQNQIIIMFI